MDELRQHSIDVITSHQASTGAYPACPSFPTYQYCWFRDGAFIAYAMDVVGRPGSAHRFHAWAVRTVRRHADQAERAIAQAERGEPLQTYLHTRHELNGQVRNDEWPNFQLDGLGTWLWSLNEHVRRTGQPLKSDWQSAVELVSRYLAALWAYPCYDLWEEYPNDLHPYTLSAIYAGLQATKSIGAQHDRWLDVAEGIRRFVVDQAVQDGHLVKLLTPADPTHNAGVHSPAPLTLQASVQVDASLIGAATPYRLLPPSNPVMRSTAARIEGDLHCAAGGVHRYLADTYYGGGEWILLAAWLGWYYAELGDRDRAWELLAWIEAQAGAEGDLPEQVASHLLAPEYHPQWEARWGPVASPLLWSHAMYLILHQMLNPDVSAET